MLYENKIKTYVSVEVLFDEAGQMLPRAVQWEDGRVFAIDKVLGRERGAVAPLGVFPQVKGELGVAAVGLPAAGRLEGGL